MFTNVIAGVLAACLVALGACGGAEREAKPATAPGSFQIVYERGGGFAPSVSRLVVRPGRHAVAESGSFTGEKERSAFRIGRGQVIALQRGLREAHFGSLENPGPSGCNDCFEYAVSYRGHRLSLDESQTQKYDGLGEVLAELESIVAAHA
jgi:hypothetical protein